MSHRWTAISETVHTPQASYTLVGLWDRQNQCGAIGLGGCERPLEVGRLGGRLRTAATKLAKAKALRRIASEAGKLIAQGSGTPQLLELATTATRTATALERSAVRDEPTRARPGDEPAELAEDLEDERGDW